MAATKERSCAPALVADVSTAAAGAQSTTEMTADAGHGCHGRRPSSPTPSATAAAIAHGPKSSASGIEHAGVPWECALSARGAAAWASAARTSGGHFVGEEPHHPWGGGVEGVAPDAVLAASVGDGGERARRPHLDEALGRCECDALVRVEELRRHVAHVAHRGLAAATAAEANDAETGPT